MNYLELWKLLNLGIAIDKENMKLTLNLGPLTIKDISLKVAKQLSKDTSLIERLLSDHFINRQVMWQDFRIEYAEGCLRSLIELKQRNIAEADRFGASRKSKDRIFAEVFQAWANECDRTIKDLKRLDDEQMIKEASLPRAGKGHRIPKALRDHRDLEREKLAKILGPFRATTYPMVEVLIDLLPDDNSIKQQAKERILAGKHWIVNVFKVPVNTLHDISWELSIPGPRGRKIPT